MSRVPHRPAAMLCCLVLLALPLSPGMAAEPERPSFEITTTEAFDPVSVPAYGGAHPEVYAHIDAHFGEHVGELQRWVRQRSISAQDDGIPEMAELVRRDLEALGFAEAELVPTGGHPGVWGYYDAGAEKTLLIYMMYDVQPVTPEDWRAPPFEGKLVEHELGTVLMARGATNQKGPERAFLNALASIIAVNGTLPVNLMVTAEGEEEIGSVHYPEIVAAYADRLRKADGVLFPANAARPDGGVILTLGVKGIAYWELESAGGKWGGPTRSEIHGSYKVLVDSPALRLVQAIASMTTPDGNTVLVPGFYEGIRPPTPEEERLINGMLDDWDDAGTRSALGVERWIDGLDGKAALVEYLYLPTLNIDGIWGGYTGPGTKTILPHVATAKMDSRLPMGMDPDDVLAKIRAHLDAQGFGELVIRKLGGYPPAQTSVDAPVVRAAIGVLNKRGYPVGVQPRIGGSAPFYVFTERLELPMVFVSPGYGTGAHGPDEFMLISPAEGAGLPGLADVEKFYVDLLYALAEE